MFLQFLFIFILGVAVGVGVCYQALSAIIQRGIDSGKIKFEVLDKRIIK